MIDESEIDFEHLTKEQALYLHRKLWSTIAELTYKLRRPVSKEEVFELYNWPYADFHCWCCEYAAQHTNHCTECPVYWGRDIYNKCQQYGSPYLSWHLLDAYYRILRPGKKCSKADLWKMIRCARKIALLPERTY